MKKLLDMRKWTHFPVRFFFCLLLPQDFSDFFSICGHHCSYSLNYSVAQPGADKAVLVDSHYFILCFRVHRFLLNEITSCDAVFFSLK